MNLLMSNMPEFMDDVVALSKVLTLQCCLNYRLFALLSSCACAGWSEPLFAVLSSCACAGWSEPLLCSPAVHVLDGVSLYLLFSPTVHVLDGVSLCSALQLCMCWMEQAFALLSGCGCAW